MQPKTPKRKSIKQEMGTPKKAVSPAAALKNGTPKIKTPKKENDSFADDSKKNGKAKKREASLSMKTEGTPSPKKAKQEISSSKKPKQEVASPKDKEAKTKSRRNRPKSKVMNQIKLALRTNDVSSVTITPENIKERISSMQSNDGLSKSAKRKLAMYMKLYNMMTGVARPNKISKPKPIKGGEVKSNADTKVKQNKKPVKEEVEDESDEEIEEEMSDEQEVMQEGSDEDEEDLEDESDESEEEVAEKPAAKKAGKKVAQPEVDSDLSEEDGDDDDDDNEESEESDDEPKVAKKEQKKPNQNAAKQGTKHVAFVGSLPFTMKLDEVREFLGNYDGVVFVEVPPHEESGKHKGFAFVHFKDEKSYQNLLSQSGKLVMKDRKIIVKPRNQKSDGGQKNKPQHNKKGKKAT